MGVFNLIAPTYLKTAFFALGMSNENPKMREFLINCLDDDWAIDYRQWSRAFHPNSIAFRNLPGTQHRIEINGVSIYFAHECPGIHVCVEGELSNVITYQIMEEVLSNLQQLTGQQGQIIEL